MLPQLLMGKVNFLSKLLGFSGFKKNSLFFRFCCFFLIHNSILQIHFRVIVRLFNLNSVNVVVLKQDHYFFSFWKIYFFFQKNITPFPLLPKNLSLCSMPLNSFPPKFATILNPLSNIFPFSSFSHPESHCHQPVLKQG